MTNGTKKTIGKRDKKNMRQNGQLSKKRRERGRGEGRGKGWGPNLKHVGVDGLPFRVGQRGGGRRVGGGPVGGGPVGGAPKGGAPVGAQKVGPPEGWGLPGRVGPPGRVGAPRKGGGPHGRVGAPRKGGGNYVFHTMWRSKSEFHRSHSITSTVCMLGKPSFRRQCSRCHCPGHQFVDHREILTSSFTTRDHSFTLRNLASWFHEPVLTWPVARRSKV